MGAEGPFLLQGVGASATARFRLDLEFGGRY